jgi:hypothetical protein
MIEEYFTNSLNNDKQSLVFSHLSVFIPEKQKQVDGNKNICFVPSIPGDKGLMVQKHLFWIINLKLQRVDDTKTFVF